VRLLSVAKKVGFTLAAVACSLSSFQTLYVLYDGVRLMESDGVCISLGGSLLGCCGYTYSEVVLHSSNARLSVQNPVKLGDVSSQTTVSSLSRSDTPHVHRSKNDLPDRTDLSYVAVQKDDKKSFCHSKTQRPTRTWVSECRKEGRGVQKERDVSEVLCEIRVRVGVK
jgi:hypothetical protein